MLIQKRLNIAKPIEHAKSSLKAANIVIVRDSALVFSNIYVRMYVGNKYIH